MPLEETEEQCIYMLCKDVFNFKRDSMNELVEYIFTIINKRFMFNLDIDLTDLIEENGGKLGLL